MFARIIERPLPAAATIVVVIAGAASALVPVGILPGQFWLFNVPHLIVGLISVAVCRWRGLRSEGRYRSFWLTLSAAMAVWSFGQAGYLILEPIGMYTFPCWLDLTVVGSNVLVCIALLIYPSEPTTTRVRRLLDSVMTTLAIALLIWQLWLGPLMSAADPNALLLDVASGYFPVAGALMLVIATITLTHSPPGRRSLAVVTIGYVLLAMGGIWYANVQSDGNGLPYAGWAWNIVANSCLVFAPLLRSAGPRREPRVSPSIASITFLPYVPLTLALAMAVVSFVNRSAGPMERLISLLLVALLLARQFLALRQNVTLTRQVQAGQEQLRHQTLHDELTGLANRTLFADRLQHALALRARDTRPISLLYVDLDGFKGINDAMGHDIGDQLLVLVADRLRIATRASDTLARLGGDELAVLLEDAVNPMASAERISEVLRPVFDIQSESIRIGCSVGVVELTSEEEISPDALLTRADVAMYHAKRSGRGRIVQHEAGMTLIDPEDRRLRDLLEAALDDGSFGVALQPIVEISTGRVVAVEALARLRHDSVDTRPRSFIEAADRTGVLPALTDAILREACARAGEFYTRTDESGDYRAVHLNVLPSQIESTALFATITDAIHSGRLQPGQLVLEIAETALGVDVSAFQEAVFGLRAAGVKIALDDFGSGHSSLSRLGDFDIDILKIAQSVLDRIDTDSRQRAIVETLLQLAERLDIPVIAQGVERPGQLDEIERLGCRFAQGYLLGRPALAERSGPMNPFGSI